MNHLVYANADGAVELSEHATRFVERAAIALRSLLNPHTISFRLMPYRHSGTQFLGADWKDSSGNSMSFTFYSSPDLGVDLPDMVPNGIHYDVVVNDSTDALLMIRLIANLLGVRSIELR